VRFHVGPTLPVRVQALECGPKLVANAEHLELLRRGVNGWNAWRTNETLIDPDLSEAYLGGADLSHADLSRADLCLAELVGANLSRANLFEAELLEANLSGANLFKAEVLGANLSGANLFKADLSRANLRLGIRKIIDTVGRKGVLLLGRFTEGRIAVLERLREELRKRGYLPIVFNFDKPETKDFTETVRLLAGLSKFVIADLTSPKSAPYELGAIVSQTMIPFKPIIAGDETPFAMLQDSWINYPDRVFQPLHYSSVDALIASLDEKIIRPAEARFVELLKRKADTMGGEHV
jgi:uncharacterized protein YjbI with pentapeptide repeats